MEFTMHLNMMIDRYGLCPVESANRPWYQYPQPCECQVCGLIRHYKLAMAPLNEYHQYYDNRPKMSDEEMVFLSCSLQYRLGSVDMANWVARAFGFDVNFGDREKLRLPRVEVPRLMEYASALEAAVMKYGDEGDEFFLSASEFQRKYREMTPGGAERRMVIESWSLPVLFLGLAFAKRTDDSHAVSPEALVDIFMNKERGWKELAKQEVLPGLGPRMQRKDGQLQPKTDNLDAKKRLQPKTDNLDAKKRKRSDEADESVFVHGRWSSLDEVMAAEAEKRRLTIWNSNREIRRSVSDDLRREKLPGALEERRLEVEVNEERERQARRLELVATAAMEERRREVEVNEERMRQARRLELEVDEERKRQARRLELDVNEERKRQARRLELVATAALGELARAALAVDRAGLELDRFFREAQRSHTPQAEKEDGVKFEGKEL